MAVRGGWEQREMEKERKRKRKRADGERKREQVCTREEQAKVDKQYAREDGIEREGDSAREKSREIRIERHQSSFTNHFIFFKSSST